MLSLYKNLYGKGFFKLKAEIIRLEKEPAQCSIHNDCNTLFGTAEIGCSLPSNNIYFKLQADKSNI